MPLDSKLPSLLATALIVTAGCSSAPPPVIPVAGAPGSVADLAGRWTGDYRLADGSRRGSITFNLAPGDSVATGDVIMVPSPGNTARPAEPSRPATETLAVRFVRVENGMLRGRLDPYTDPDCACPVETVFEGRLKGNRIEGAFVIRNTIDGTTRAGTWTTTRRAAGLQ